jgi:hypothetical protein
VRFCSPIYGSSARFDAHANRETSLRSGCAARTLNRSFPGPVDRRQWNGAFILQN